MRLNRIFLYMAIATALPAQAWDGDGIDWKKSEAVSENALSEQYRRFSVSPSWMGTSSVVSYDRMRDGKKEAVIFTPETGKSELLINDIDGFLSQYRTLTGDTAMKAKDLSLYNISFRDNDTSRFYWKRKGKQMVYDRASGTLTLDNSPEEGKKGGKDMFRGYGRGAQTTDSLFTMLGDRYNLYVRDNRTGNVRQLTTDGKDYASYCYRSQKDTIKEGNASGYWLGHVYIDFVSDDSEVGELYIINSLAKPRPQLSVKKMPLPNEKGVRRFKLFWYNADTGEGRLLPIDKFKDQNVALDFLRTEHSLWFTRRSRSVDTIQLCRIDVPTGKIHELITEVSKPHLSVNLFKYYLINDGKEIIWWSERTGRGNYYLYDFNGKLKNRITQGDNIVAGNIDYIDEKNRTIIFAGYGAEKGVNPYYRQFYRVGFDGKRQQQLTSGNGDHELQLSFDHRYAIDKCSRMDMPPVYSCVSIDNPKHRTEIARVPVDSLKGIGWHAPKLITVKAADGKTDLYGLMYTPSDLDPAKKYPIISNVYPGPQDDQIPQSFFIDDQGNQSLSELGFIVVNVAARGSSPYRGHDFLCYGYGDLRDYPLADDKHAIEQLAARYNFIDTTRVGIYGHSGGGFETVAAMCTYPDFYKVGIAASGNHDNNIYIQWWAETWNGLRPAPTNMEIAKNLKGKLLLMSGDMDGNVPYASTLRMADALIRNNKRFDMLVMPGKDHGLDSPYYFNLIKYYFLENLVHPTPRDIDIVNHK